MRTYLLAATGGDGFVQHVRDQAKESFCRLLNSITHIGM
jgi:hypothetical protein